MIPRISDASYLQLHPTKYGGGRWGCAWWWPPAIPAVTYASMLMPVCALYPNQVGLCLVVAACAVVNAIIDLAFFDEHLAQASVHNVNRV